MPNLRLDRALRVGLFVLALLVGGQPPVQRCSLCGSGREQGNARQQEGCAVHSITTAPPSRKKGSSSKAAMTNCVKVSDSGVPK